ncbi:hypothetical protein RA263_22175 [Pseudomonas syringae pv. tagetis]|uniref:Ribosomal protein S8 n=2 Tax=Pseudomonas syringae group genomosp. 7 TaxID=251699 RepID=A0A0Q0BXN3_9PSED|nr:hypothetical protein [Pseudomonas syringae group genomosp. 7]KPX44586.1 Uncharacterized protein ALO68_04655 [Pseudomonas syringae pv. helianthi]KPY83167.1 Uncharacterized protein ALO44_04424 [Pseudomonas syringae pv. tagetis]RMR04192.1 hypothetical protein ALP93_00800 [Pseudomonas syringae pv. helianthi]RMV52579.1 hypothetical protein ALP10_01264 [Pseudomonas syringae pv. helianthi]RMW12888.1 hypothetical protein ALO98_02974 [Pseudomonas syringae pv. tagetis]
MFKTIARSLLLIATFTLCQAALADQSKRPLFFFLFIHDDVKETSDARLAQDYFAWLIKDLESFTGRRVHLQFARNVPEVTDFQYKNENTDQTYDAWRSEINKYLTEQNLPINGTSKYLLVTQSRMNSTTVGFANIGGNTGIASLETFTAPAHELGHMLGGTHELAEVIYKGGWWCETNLVATRQSVRANCYFYSDKNKQKIVANLSEYP